VNTALWPNITHRPCKDCRVLIRAVSGRELCLHCATVGEAACAPIAFDALGYYRSQQRLFAEQAP
jgi:hypothetical protein